MRSGPAYVVGRLLNYQNISEIITSFCKLISVVFKIVKIVPLPRFMCKLLIFNRKESRGCLIAEITRN